MTRRERQVQYVWFIYLDKWNHCQLILAKRFRCLLLGSKCNLYQIWFCQNFFFLLPTVAQGNGLKEWTCSLFSFRTTASGHPLSLSKYSKRAIHSVWLSLHSLEKTNGKTRKYMYYEKLNVQLSPNKVLIDVTTFFPVNNRELDFFSFVRKYWFIRNLIFIYTFHVQMFLTLPFH